MKVQCVLYPGLEIDENARVFIRETGQEIIPQLEHSLSINGPVVYYRKDGKTRNLSLRSLYFAAHIKGCKISRGTTRYKYIYFSRHLDKYGRRVENAFQYNSVK